MTLRHYKDRLTVHTFLLLLVASLHYRNKARHIGMVPVGIGPVYHRQDNRL